MKKFGIAACAAFGVLTSSLEAQTQPASSPEAATVYIECTPVGGGAVRQGSGVLISESGAVLTAKHVVQGQSTCRGVVGTAAQIPTRLLVRAPTQPSIDAALMRFVQNPANERFPFLCGISLERDMAGHDVVALGFPGGAPANSGVVTQHRGNIAQSNIDSNGIFGISAMMSPGMSGGPVVHLPSKRVIGIVAGADFDPTSGVVSRFGALSFREIAPFYQLPTNNQCDAGTGAVIGKLQDDLLNTIAEVTNGTCPQTMSPLLMGGCMSQQPRAGELARARGKINNIRYLGKEQTPMGEAEVYLINYERGLPMTFMIGRGTQNITIFWSPVPF
jgi:hypothetical protein